VNSKSIDLIYESTHDNSHQQLENDLSEATINLQEDNYKSTKKIKKNKDNERASSRESSMSRASRRRGNNDGEPGVNPLIIKGMQDRMESINKNIDDIHAKSIEGFNTVMQFSESFLQLKKKYEEESDSRQILEERISFVNKIINNMELQ